MTGVFGAVRDASKYRPEYFWPMLLLDVFGLVVLAFGGWLFVACARHSSEIDPYTVNLHIYGAFWAIVMMFTSSVVFYTSWHFIALIRDYKE